MGQSSAGLLSVAITVHNEGDELRRTIESVRQNTNGECEIIVVDDGSTDGCCDNADLKGVRLIRHTVRIGVAASRHEASCIAAGAVLAFLDGHQRVEQNSLEACAELALQRRAIVWPDVCGLDDGFARAHGAFFKLSRMRPPFSAEWKSRLPSKRVTRISALRAPGYVIPKAVYPKVRWIDGLRGWGASEAAVSVKAFFTGVDILHLCGPLVRHRFKTSFAYEVRWPEVWRNHALIARVCFDERSWHDYWLPDVFAPQLTTAAHADLESAAVIAEHEEFQQLKARPDRDFWTGLLFRDPPATVRR